jgi:phosphoribosylformylglycinamidine cyclo-ligase
MHAAVGDDRWFADEQRSADLAQGFADGCRQAQAVWGGGETPTLKGIVNPQTIVLAGSAVGRIRPKSSRMTGDIRDGDAIILLASSGVHTNGLTLCRTLADRLEQGYLTKIGDGRSYGEALLDPSVIYVRFISALAESGIRPHYAVHITGHGWRKLMRLPEPFVYRVTQLPARMPAVFDFLVSRGPLELAEAYATFNMGAGFAVMVAPDQARKCVDVARRTGYDAWVAGNVVKQGDRKAVEIAPLGLMYDAATLQVR